MREKRIFLPEQLSLISDNRYNKEIDSIAKKMSGKVFLKIKITER
jgi:hypothetical protein